MSGKRYVIGDIHGAHKALIECFEASSFSRKDDLLICLGDVCDGWPEVNKVFDELLGIENLVYILGNHDKWALDWFLHGNAPSIWIHQGGNATVESYREKVPETHIQLLTHSLLYYKLDNRVFVHGGFDPTRKLEEQEEQIFLWDRELVYNAMQQQKVSPGTHLTSFDEVFVGHTPTLNFGSTKPIKACEVILMDTGSGWPGGVLSMMDIDSGKVTHSSFVNYLYPDYAGRG
ncbi:MAG: metallophosphoesterase [Bacteroidales bacterium]|nr:metallophosphoesterase [Bacteroidales bacterium]